MMAILGLLFCCDYTMSFFFFLSMLFRVCACVCGCIKHSFFSYLLCSLLFLYDRHRQNKKEKNIFQSFLFLHLYFVFFFFVQFVYHLYTNRELFSFEKWWQKEIEMNIDCEGDNISKRKMHISVSHFWLIWRYYWKKESFSNDTDTKEVGRMKYDALIAR
jgi:hypothetical protein